MKRFTTWFLLLSGLILSLLSATDLCSFGGCTEAHSYRFYGVRLPILGCSYFVVLTGLVAARPQLAQFLADCMLAAGIGAELVFIHLQKNVIGAWCPLCLGIAAVILLLILIRLSNLLPLSRRNTSMPGKLVFGKPLLLLTVAALSFVLTLGGMSQPQALASDLNITLGKQNSKVEVYVFSDWFCPSCIKAEPAIEAAFPTISRKARVTFVDKAIHAEAMNFVPFHLSFAAKEKEKYLELRRALFALAKRTKTPTNEDVRTAISPLRVTYQQLSFLDVTQTMARFQALSDKFKVKGTPTVIITNSSTQKTRTLYGAYEITTEALIKAVKELE